MVDAKFIRARINKLHPWFCPAVIGGIPVTAGIGSNWDHKKLTSRYAYRHKLIVDAIIDRFPMVKKTVLDIGCNCGYWSARYAEHGAIRVIGLEGRIRFINQALLYWEINQYLPKDRYAFLHANVADGSTWKNIKKYGKFEIGLCAGLLYHIPNYRDMLTSMASFITEALVIDTRVIDTAEKMEREPGNMHFNAIAATQDKVVPNITNLLQHIRTIGFVPEVIPANEKIVSGLTGKDDYTKQNRVTIFALKVR